MATWPAARWQWSHDRRYFKQVAMATQKSKTTARQQQISF
jgi:hypothetical protein